MQDLKYFTRVCVPRTVKVIYIYIYIKTYIWKQVLRASKLLSQVGLYIVFTNYTKNYNKNLLILNRMTFLLILINFTPTVTCTSLISNLRQKDSIL